MKNILLFLLLSVGIACAQYQTRDMYPATQTEVDTGTNTSKAVTPATLAATTLSPGTFLNVKNLGAKGDGVTDDTAAIQSAIGTAVSQKKTLIFPAGTYQISGTISVTSKYTHLQGAGARLTFIRQSGTASALVIGDDCNNFTVRDITFQGPGASTSLGDGLECHGGTGCIDGMVVEGCEFRGFNIGIYAENVSNSRISMCGFGADSPNNIGIQFIQNCNSNTVIGCPIVNNNTAGIINTNGRGLTVESCDLGGPTQPCQIRNQNSASVSIIGCNLECYTGTYAVENFDLYGSVSLINTAIYQYGTTAYSLGVGRDNGNTIINSGLGCYANSTSSPVYTNWGWNVTLTTPSPVGVAAYSGTTLLGTYNSGPFDGEASTSPQVASLSNWGRVVRLIRTGTDDALNISVRNSDGSYSYANLLSYYSATKANGNPAFTGTANTFTASQYIQSSVFPCVRFTTGAYTSGSSATFVGIATSTSQGGNGTVTGDTVVSAKSGGAIDFCTAPAGSLQSVVWKIGTLGDLICPTKVIIGTGTDGAATINSPAGRVNFATGATSLTVTNSLCTPNSIITVTSNSISAGVTPSVLAASGSFTIVLSGTPAVETPVNFILIN